MWFNCRGPKLCASDFFSNKTSPNCKRKHHPSICEKTSNVLLTTNDNNLTYSLVITDIEDIKWCTSIDTRAAVSYASSNLLDRINKKPIGNASIQTYQYKRIETTMSSATKSIPVHPIEIRDSDHEFKFLIEISQQEKSVPLELSNLEY